MSNRWLGVGIGVLCILGAGLLAVGCGSSNAQSELRVLNASPNVGSIDVLVDTATVASDIGYATATSYISIKSGSRDLQINTTGTTTSLLTATLSIGESTQTTVIVANYAANLGAVVLADSTTAPVSGSAQIRVVNAAPNMGPVDIYIVPSGTDLATTTPVATAVAFETGTDYVTETAGTYHIFFTVTGSTFAYLDSGAISFGSGQNRTVVALNSPSGSYEALTLADLN